MKGRIVEAIPTRVWDRAYVLGIISASSWSGGRTNWVSFKARRPYILGIKRQAWGYPWHWLRRHHWYEPVWLGMCGKCAPWPCCGATGMDHAEHCGGGKALEEALEVIRDRRRPITIEEKLEAVEAVIADGLRRVSAA